MPRPRLAALLALAASIAAAVAIALTAQGASSTSEPASPTVAAGDAAGSHANPPSGATAPASFDGAATVARTREQRRRAQLRRLERRIVWRPSTTVGSTGAGSLVDGVRLPREGLRFFTLDPVRWTTPNRPDRRWGSDRLVETLLRVARDFARENPGAPRMAIGDLSRPHGGSFDATHGVVGEFGPGNSTLGHVSHQNGLDADVYYPRLDGREDGPRALEQIDRRLAQDLVDRFVAAGAEFVFVGPRTGLTGPPGIVQPAPRHDDHLHVRLPSAG